MRNPKCISLNLDQTQYFLLKSSKMLFVNFATLLQNDFAKFILFDKKRSTLPNFSIAFIVTAKIDLISPFKRSVFI